MVLTWCPHISIVATIVDDFTLFKTRMENWIRGCLCPVQCAWRQRRCAWGPLRSLFEELQEKT